MTIPSSSDCTEWKLCGGPHGDEARDHTVAPEVGDVLVERQVAQAVGVVGQEHLLALQILAHAQQALADVGMQAGVDEGDAPVVDVARQQLDLLAALGQHEVVRHALVVVEEVLADQVAAVARGTG